jgi:hypothetical protein
VPRLSWWSVLRALDVLAGFEFAYRVRVEVLADRVLWWREGRALKEACCALRLGGHEVVVHMGRGL